MRVFDEEDRNIAAALLVHPRASWHLIADVLDVALSTVARRGKKLLYDGDLRVIGNVDVMAAGTGFPVLSRIECEQKATAQVAENLATRSDVRGVTTTASSYQCFADFIVPSQSDLSTLMVEDLPVLPGIRSVDAHVVLRRFTTAHSWDCGVLMPEQVSKLRSARPDSGQTSAEPRPMDNTDRNLSSALETNGRASWRDLATAADVEQRTAQRRVLDLMSRGILRMRTFVRPSDIGLGVTATLWMNVDPAHLEAVGVHLAPHPAVTLLVATTGRFNLCATVSVADNRALYDFMTLTLGRISAVRTLDIAVEMTTLKKMNIMHPYKERSS